MDALILCGGKGTRLASLVTDVPKPLAPVCGRPFLDYLLLYLGQSGMVDRVILATGHLAERVLMHYGSNFEGLRLLYSEEMVPLGTGGAVLKALHDHCLSETFLVLNGDSFVDANLTALVELVASPGCEIAMGLFPVSDAARFGTVSADGLVVKSFSEKAGLNVAGLINAGVYACRQSAFRTWRSVPGFLSLEREVLPILVELGSVCGVSSGTKFIDIGLPETYRDAQSFFGGWDLAAYEKSGYL